MGGFAAAAFFPTLLDAQQSGQPQCSERPNIVFIIADDMGWADLACYGNPYTRTPNIDRLAAEGVRFTQGYAGSAVSSPSRCALITGMHTGHTRIRNNFVDAGGIEGPKGNGIVRRQGLTEEDATIAHLLKERGYVTGVVNKWHMDGFDKTAGPLDRGFDEFRGWLVSTVYSNDPYYYPEWRFHGRELIKIPENENGGHARHNNDISTEDALDFIGRHRDEPFFLYLAYDAPHEPYNIDDTGVYDDYAWDDTSKRYASLITSMDAGVGRVMACLDSLSLTDRTVVVFMSDNGGASMAPHKTLRPNGILRGQKGNFYEGGIRVPIIVRMPGTPQGSVSRQPVYFPDILPTVAELTGCTPPENTDGTSLVPILRGEELDLTGRPMYWEFTGRSYALRLGEWKIVRPSRDRPTELYRIDGDIGETTDLASRYPEIVARLEALASKMSRPSVNFPKGWQGFGR